ncbi:MAG: hypothetical protein RMK29_07915 [Myxococcales bacterium]|nr:hypothetical protein [Myxococcota bacterium]MDW8281620.1 hypothetical protein [Myxococcales bacterium]
MGCGLPHVRVVALCLLLAAGCRALSPAGEADLAEADTTLEPKRPDLATPADLHVVPADLHAVPDQRGVDDLALPTDLHVDLHGTPDLGGSDGCGDTSSDPLHCGACGRRCPAGHLCCYGECRDPATDPAHCRFCGHSCGGNACCGGLCTSLSTPANCGACGRRCPDGHSCCEGACVDRQRDPSHCGACGLSCGPGQVCAGGRCLDADGGPADLSEPGCLRGGASPPSVCLMGRDPVSSAPYTVCRADCMSAWLHHAEPGGGQFSFQTICQNLGYSRAAQWGGSCGDMCGHCEGRMTSCLRPGTERYDGAGLCGPDCLQRTVMWQCVR